MRTTLTIDKDIAVLIERIRQAKKASLKAVVNEALRLGLQGMTAPPAPRKPFVTKSWDLGKCLLPSLDNIEDVLDQVEGPWRK